MNALDGETEFLPALEGGGFVPFQTSSSEMSKSEMADLITLILKWGDEHGIEWEKDEEQSKPVQDQSPDNHSPAYQAGYSAAEDSQLRNTCPQAKDVAEMKDWFRGWDDRNARDE